MKIGDRVEVINWGESFPKNEPWAILHGLSCWVKDSATHYNYVTRQGTIVAMERDTLPTICGVRIDYDGGEVIIGSRGLKKLKKRVTYVQ